MVFYDFSVAYDLKSEAISQLKDKKQDTAKKRNSDEKTQNPNEIDIQEMIGELNENLGVECAMDGNLSVFVLSGKPEQFQIVAGCRLEKVKLEECKAEIVRLLKEAMPRGTKLAITAEKEICPKDVTSILRRPRGNSPRRGIGGWVHHDLNIDYFENGTFRTKEKCYETGYTLEQALERADEIMGHDTLREELARIYSLENAKQYYGNPVHYKLTVGSAEAAMEIVDILVPALRANERLLGSRVNRIFEIQEGCFDEEDLKNLMEIAQGNSVVIEMKGADGEIGNYASSYERVVDYFNEQIEKYGLYTLCFFVEDVDQPGFSRRLISKIQSDIDIVEIKEGFGNYEQAVNYFLRMSEKTDFPVTKEEIEEILPYKKTYTISEVQSIYKKWFGNGLKNHIYKSYKSANFVEFEEVQKKDTQPYKELQSMVGLSEIKGVVDQVLANAKIQKMRSKMGMDAQKSSMHMIFTGNPGTAKTTVARLLSEILMKEGILERGNFVEVGRADLIARYVGWTAKTVREKFLQARGGILFIDEAYSLVDGSNSFGDEAINTIVQEMENHRDEVIVIFAGYPDKMKAFLEKNEGLRSRIAFHLDFPDYNADEMTQIMKLMAEGKGYQLSEEILGVCKDIFEDACRHEEFGNGRFARNLLEQALMNQANRLCEENKGKRISRAKLKELKPEDFHTNAKKQYKENKFIGFAGLRA